MEVIEKSGKKIEVTESNREYRKGSVAHKCTARYGCKCFEGTFSSCYSLGSYDKMEVSSYRFLRGLETFQTTQVQSELIFILSLLQFMTNFRKLIWCMYSQTVQYLIYIEIFFEYKLTKVTWNWIGGCFKTYY